MCLLNNWWLFYGVATVYWIIAITPRYLISALDHEVNNYAEAEGHLYFLITLSLLSIPVAAFMTLVRAMAIQLLNIINDNFKEVRRALSLETVIAEVVLFITYMILVPFLV